MLYRQSSCNTKIDTEWQENGFSLIDIVKWIYRELKCTYLTSIQAKVLFQNSSGTYASRKKNIFKVNLVSSKEGEITMQAQQ